MSYKHVIVPLDGSKLAECVLPHLKEFAAASGIDEVELVRVAPPIELHYKAALPFDSKDETKMNQAEVKEAEEYLKKTRAAIEAWGLKVTTKVLVGPVAESLIDYMKKTNPDLLLLTTHGRSGASRWIWGSVAEKLLRSSTMPVFLVRPASCTMGI
jgi:nucleotide-binding universal stress UspA family protein